VNLIDELDGEFEVILPDMPNKINAKYLEWKIWFEKFIPYFEPEMILIGHSLGGTFLAKYLSENKFPKKIRAVFLVAAPFNVESAKDSLADFILAEDLNKIAEQTKNIFLYYSQDDPQVSFDNFKKYESKLKNSVSRIFKNKGHFRQETFPELVEDIKKTGKS